MKYQMLCGKTFMVVTLYRVSYILGVLLACGKNAYNAMEST